MRSPMPSFHRHEIPGNRWDELIPPTGASWTPSRRVSVCIPARTRPDTLQRTLSALAAQTYPSDLFEVVVTDDSSDPALDLSQAALPFHVRVVRQDAQGFAAGRARARAAAEANGEVLWFLDADVVPGRSVMESYLRWFDRCEAVVPFGFLRFVDLSAAEGDVDNAIHTHDLEVLCSLTQVDDQHWRDRTFLATDDLRHETSDMFRTLVGASLAVSARQYAEVGGFADLGVRGVEDIEFGYRLQNNGAILIPDRGAVHWHDGGRTMSGDRVAAIRRDRAPFVDALLPVGGFRGARPALDSPVPVVPRLIVYLDPAIVGVDELAEHISVVDGTDVHVTVGVAHDGFVAGYAQLVLTSTVEWSPGAARRITEHLERRDLGTLFITGIAGSAPLEVVRTRALRAAASGAASERIGRKLFDVGVATASEIGLGPNTRAARSMLNSLRRWSARSWRALRQRFGS